MPRIFTGLEIPADVALELSMLRGGLPGARWIDPENYHMTLRFIGDVDDMVAQEVAIMLGQVRRTEFELRFDALSSFGGRRPRALVATLAQTQALMDLQAEHERLMRRVGLDAEGRKYTPHVTLARLRESSSRQVADYLSACRASCCSLRALRPVAALMWSRPPIRSRPEALALARRPLLRLAPSCSADAAPRLLHARHSHRPIRDAGRRR
jgi:2'-5' RNA ligase